MKKITTLLLLLLFFCQSFANTNPPVVRYYTDEEIKELNLKPIVLESGEIIRPMHDGKHFIVTTENPFAQNMADSKVTPEQVVAVLEKAKQVGADIFAFLTMETAAELPLAIKKKIGGVSYTIGIDELVFSPFGNALKVYAAVETQKGQKICFFGNVGFSGQGGIKEGTLGIVLGENNALELIKLSKVKLDITGGSIKFDCDGYNSFSLAGTVTFDRTLIVPDDPATGESAGGNVKSNFSLIDVKNFNDMLVEISMQPFQIPKMKGYGFEVSNAVIDVSDLRNSAMMGFPTEYTPAETGALWQGVYVGRVAVRFPKHFKKRTSPLPIKIGVDNLLIDRFGVSGEIFGQNLLTIVEGDLSGWDFSLEEARVVLVRSQVKRGSLAGKMRVSVSSETTLLDYKAIIDPTNDYYNFTVSNSRPMAFEFLKAANVNLKPSSFISLTLANGKFNASANLHGSMALNPDKFPLKLEDFTFESLQLSTQAPYMKVGYFSGGSSSEYALAGFPISLVAPQIRGSSEAVLITFGINVNLDKAGIAAQGGFTISGGFESVGGRHFWRNKSFVVNTLSVAGDLSICSFRGAINYFSDDGVYGNGFGGSMQLDLKVASNTQVNIAALFGTKDSKRYWFLDGVSAPGSTSSGAGFTLKMLAGTFFKHMKAVPGKGAAGFKSTTGMVYEPDFNIGWGARFAVGMATTGGGSMDGLAGLDILTNADGSLRKIGILGSVSVPSTNVSPQEVMQQYNVLCSDGELMNPDNLSSSLDSDPNAVAACRKFENGSKGDNGFSASVLLKLDYTNNSFYGKVGVRFTTPAGLGIQGVGVFYFAPNSWYVHLGEPPANSRIMLKFPTLPKFDAYVMFGHGINGLPDPEPNIFDKYPNQRQNRHRPANAETPASGKGIALGAALSVGSSGKFLVVSYNVNVRAGLDAFLTKYPDGTYCAGRAGQPIGINNWRAGAQIYAIGTAKASAFGFDVLDVGIGALLRGSTPNPTFAMGQLAVNFKMLFISYNFKMSYSLGEECEAMGGESAIQAAELIENNFPNDGDKMPTPFKGNPNVTFLYPVEQSINMDGFNGQSRIKILDFKVINKENGFDIPGNWRIDPVNNKKVLFTPVGDFPTYPVNYLATLRITAETNNSGGWQRFVFDNKPFELSKQFTFSSGKSLEEYKEDIRNLGAGLPTVTAKITQNGEDLTQTVNAQLQGEEKKSQEDLKKVGDEVKYTAKSIMGAVNTLVPPLGPADSAAVSTVVKKATNDASTILSTTAIDVGKIYNTARTKIGVITEKVKVDLAEEGKNLEAKVGEITKKGLSDLDTTDKEMVAQLALNEQSYQDQLIADETYLKDVRSECAVILESSSRSTDSDQDVSSIISLMQSRSLQARSASNDPIGVATRFCRIFGRGMSGSNMLKNKAKKEFNVKDDQIRTESAVKFKRVSDKATSSANYEVMQSIIRSNALVIKAKIECEQIIKAAAEEAKEKIADAQARCKVIMDNAITESELIINRTRGPNNQVNLSAEVAAYQLANPSNKKEDFDTVADQSDFLFEASTPSISPTLISTPINGNPVVGTEISKGTCKGISQIRDNAVADGSGGQQLVPMFDPGCPTQLSQLTWKRFATACESITTEARVIDVAVAGLAVTRYVEFSEDEGGSWKRANEGVNGYTFTTTSSNATYKIWARASDVPPHIETIVAGCPPPVTPPVITPTVTADLAVSPPITYDRPTLTDDERDKKREKELAEVEQQLETDRVQRRQIERSAQRHIEQEEANVQRAWAEQQDVLARLNELKNQEDAYVERQAQQRERDAEIERQAQQRDQDAESERQAQQRKRDAENERQAQQRKRDAENERQAQQREQDVEIERQAQQRERDAENERQAQQRERDAENERQAQQREQDAEKERQATWQREWDDAIARQQQIDDEYAAQQEKERVQQEAYLAQFAADEEAIQAAYEAQQLAIQRDMQQQNNLNSGYNCCYNPDFSESAYILNDPDNYY